MNTNDISNSGFKLELSNLSMGNIVDLENTIYTPLSPILSNNTNQRKIIHTKKKSKTNLISKYEDKPKTEQKSKDHHTQKNINDVAHVKSDSPAKEKKYNQEDKSHKRKDKLDVVFGNSMKPDVKVYKPIEMKREHKANEGCSPNSNKTRQKSGKEVGNGKETIININIKGYKTTQDRNQNNANKEVNSPKKNFHISVSSESKPKNPTDRAHNKVKPNNFNENIATDRDVTFFDLNEKSKVHNRKVDSEIDCNASVNLEIKRDMHMDEKPEKLVNFTQEGITDSQLNAAVEKISHNVYALKHESKSNVLNKSPKTELTLNTQDTDYYFANFTQKLSNKKQTENVIDNIYLVQNKTNPLDVTNNKYLADSETSECNTLPHSNLNLKISDDGYRGTTEEDSLIVSKSSRIISNVFTKFEEDLEATRQCVKKQKQKQMVSINKNNINKFEQIEHTKSTALYKKSKSMDVLSGCSTNSKAVATCTSEYPSPTKNIHIEIKKNNVIDIQINSSADEQNEVRIEQKRVLEDKFLLHQQQLSRTVKEANENLRFDQNLDLLKRQNRRKQVEDIDTALAPANKRNKYESKRSPLKSTMKKCSPRKNKPMLNVINVAASTNSHQQHCNTNNFVSLFVTVKGKEIKPLVTSEQALKKYQNRFRNDFDFAQKSNLDLKKTSTSRNVMVVPEFPSMSDQKLNISKTNTYNKLDQKTNKNYTNCSASTSKTLDQNINSILSEYPSCITSTSTTPAQTNINNDFYKELYSKDIREILNPVTDASVSVTEEATNSEVSCIKKDHEIIQDAIDMVNTALEKIEKREQSKGSVQKRKTLGVVRRKLMATPAKEIPKTKYEATGDTSLSTPKLNKTLHLESSTPVNEVAHNFVGDFITPIKPKAKRNLSYQYNDDNDYILVNDFEQEPSTKTDYLKELDRLKRQMEIVQERKEVLEIQDDLIENGNTEHRTYRTGYLLGLKNNRKKVLLKELEIMKKDVPLAITRIAPNNAIRIQFNMENNKEFNDSVVRTIDGAIVIPDVQNKIGFHQIERAFKAMPGIKPSFIPKNWLANHFKWIVWKLASYERKFLLSDQILSIENIVQQLKYRYDKELYEAKHPTLRKILEGDDIPEKRMVLCVSDILTVSENNYELELTDGWYPIKCSIDSPLMRLISKKNIIIGTKITIQCAKLENSMPCSPLEVSERTRLIINYNNTRKAEWYAKLGYQKASYYRPISLSAIHPNGGVVSCLKLYIARVYPVKYLEIEKNKRVWRNENAENIAQQKHELDLENAVEEFAFDLNSKKNNYLADAVKNCKPIDPEDVVNINCPETLYALLEQSKDPKKLMSKLTTEQMDSVMKHKERLEQNIQNQLINEITKFKYDKKRNVLPVMKFLVYDADGKSAIGMTLTLWGYNDETQMEFKEEKAVLAYNLLPDFAGNLKSTPKTYFDNIISKPIVHLRRKLLTISELLDEQHISILNDEFDTIGVFIKSYEDNCQQIWFSDFVGRLLRIKIPYPVGECSFTRNLNIGKLTVIGNLKYCKPKFGFAQAYADHCTVMYSFCKITYLKEAIEAFQKQLPEHLEPLIESCSIKIEMLRKNGEILQDSFNDKSTVSTKDVSSLSDFAINTLLPNEMTEDDIAMGQLNISY